MPHSGSTHPREYSGDKKEISPETAGAEFSIFSFSSEGAFASSVSSVGSFVRLRLADLLFPDRGALSFRNEFAAQLAHNY